jgi:hypothetical protein
MKVVISYRIIFLGVLLASCHASTSVDNKIMYDDTLAILKASLDTASAFSKENWSRNFQHKVSTNNLIITTESELDSIFTAFFLKNIQNSSLKYITSTDLCRQVFDEGKWNSEGEFTTLTYFRKDSLNDYWVVLERGGYVRQTVVQEQDTLESCHLKVLLPGRCI